MNFQSLVNAQIEVNRAVFAMNQACDGEMAPDEADIYIKKRIKNAIKDLEKSLKEEN